ncbi:hypothetical protein Cgig2_032596 [Carnegiea gigantea]|uniref:Uncharacterized protein n=1 Tax=Carnegiea gigantea TaxID=171969 RepID=A0A9Q1KU53_9CARY|nr:hypothetical protein Cgig2_032596 [Carnegiea gigantea]
MRCKCGFGSFEIRTWKERNIDVKFLEDKLSNSQDEREIYMLSNLMEFLYYCIGVIFQTWDKSQEIINEANDARRSQEATYEIKSLVKSNVFNKSVIIDAGNVPPLSYLLMTPDPNTQSNVIATLLKLRKHPKGRKAIINKGGLMPLISVLRDGLRMESKESAASIILYLSSVDRYRIMISATVEGILTLMYPIKDGTFCGKKKALAANFCLLLYRGNHEVNGILGKEPTIMATFTRFFLFYEPFARLLLMELHMLARRHSC